MTNITQMARKVPSLYWWLLALVVAILLPLPVNVYYQRVLWTVGIYLLLGLSLNIIVGYAGLFQLGHAAFYALGGYTAAILNLQYHVPIFLCLPAGIVVAGVAGFLICRPILHLRGDYLCIITIAFGEIVRLVLVNNPGGVTGGSNGLFGLDFPTIFGFTFSTVLQHYYLVLFFVVLTFLAMQRLENSRLGRAWMYVREDELAAEAMGVDVVWVKTIAFVLGSAWAGLAGVLYATSLGGISPDMGNFLTSVTIFCIVVLGGAGSLPGMLVGTIGMVVLPEAFRFVDNWRDGFVGLAMVLMMIFRPAGLLPSRRIAIELLSGESETETPPSEIELEGLKPA
jgi:branched-chain amino acid transport system permease protein